MLNQSQTVTIPDDKPRLVSVVTLDGVEQSALLALAASRAGALPGPFAAAILDSAREREVSIAPPAQSVELGDSASFAALGFSTDVLGDWPARLQRQGQSVLWVAVEGRTVGLLGIQEATFPTDTAGLQEARTSEMLDLADGDQFDLHIAPVTKRLGDARVRMLSYNGSVPGPTLRVRQGSELLVTVINDGDLEATVHWHGLRLDNRYDGTTRTQSPIPVGGRFTYRLAFPDPRPRRTSADASGCHQRATRSLPEVRHEVGARAIRERCGTYRAPSSSPLPRTSHRADALPRRHRVGRRHGRSEPCDDTGQHAMEADRP